MHRSAHACTRTRARANNSTGARCQTNAGPITDSRTGGATGPNACGYPSSVPGTLDHCGASSFAVTGGPHL